MEQTSIISVVVPTVGRQSLKRTIQSILNQDIPKDSIEIIVVNDSGNTLDASFDELSDPRVTIVTTNKRRQSIARNTGAALARGKYLLFLDDDDWLEPNALVTLFDIMVANPNFVVAYGGVSFVDKTGKLLGSLNLGVSGNCASHMLAGALILLGSAIIRTDSFFAIGGFNPALTISEEIELFRRLAMVGDLGNTSSVVLKVLRGDGWGSSVDYGPAVTFLRTSRENILDQRHVFVMLIQSAKTPYWRGRNVKAYLASIKWNMKNKRPMKIMSRSFGLMLMTLFSGSAILYPDFWQAMRDSQVPASMQRSLKNNGEGKKR